MMNDDNGDNRKKLDYELDVSEMMNSKLEILND